MQAISQEIGEVFGENGRILIRPSGTEALVRVMVEGQDEKLVNEMAQKAAKVIEELYSK